ncbi:methyltransferase family protein [Sulfuriflexus mobilis]|uniref:methyltransferase family protein n=1 Tax=Sulfuriflexus mobilis TaxID=1811807 RepID=UPI001559BCE5|nr:isoprenylcysteine carboxylmethyltransferase family protein [Sulfuriflexus mobilis]
MITRKTWSTTRLLIASIAGLGFFAVIVFWPAGRIDWVEGWLYFGIVTMYMFINFVYLRRVNPEVIEHRLRLGKGTKLWDKIWLTFFTPVFLAIYVIAGFDTVRFEWSTMPLWLWPLGLALWLPGTALFTWSMGVNPFFEKTVRIQTERGHRVIDTGPYSFVRHPGYLGLFGWSLSTPLLLGSWWAFLPALLSIVSLVIRTALEDRTLHEELTGYREYASRVRYRLIPSIW